MKTEAAILVESGRDLEIAEIDIPSELSAGQVLVRVITSGICGAQLNEIDAVKGPDKFLPHLLGHEGFCEILDKSADVTKVKPGDFAIMHWRPSAGVQSQTPKYGWNGKTVNAGWVTTFNRHSIISENRLTKISPTRLSRNILPLLGCALTTAYGVATKELVVSPESRVIIFGAGGVGLALLKVLKAIDLINICVVDNTIEKLALATQIGVENTFYFSNKNQVASEINSYYKSNLPDIAIDTTGKIPCIELAYECSNSEATVLLVGVPKFGELASFYTLPLHFGKRLVGSKGGSAIPDVDIPILMEMISSGKLKLNDFPTHSYKLTDINNAISDLRGGKIGRMVIDMELQA